MVWVEIVSNIRFQANLKGILLLAGHVAVVYG
jgi:hypothetical protein